MPTNPSRRSALRRVVVRSIAVGTVVALTLGSAALAGDDLDAKRDETRGQLGETNTELDILRAGEAEIRARLAELEVQKQDAQAAHQAATEAATRAEAEVAVADAAVETKRREIAELERKREQFAVRSYVQPDRDEAFIVLDSHDANEAAVKKTLLDARAGRDRQVLDDLAQAEDDLAAALEEADAAAAAARTHRDEVATLLVSIDALQAEQNAIAVGVSERMESALAEAAVLAETDAELSMQITARDRALADLAAGPGRAMGAVGIPQGPIALANVRGIIVAASIAPQLEAMLAAAAADGVVLTGSGYRDITRQIELRRQNCGDSEYAIYVAPPDACHPPTARPGLSNHERGLAIDFRYNGASINSHSNPGFIWLAANASKYGFYNLPSEPWHWSTSGR